jgi:LDH2 family malate/lactate/ureidoglycolate dehydrogenase
MLTYQTLYDFSMKVLKKTGLSPAKSNAVAETLIEGDLLGHHTHGLQLLPAYIDELQSGMMEKQGSYEILNDFGAILAVDGRYLPGPFLVKWMLKEAERRVKKYGLVTITIQKSHHIACLAAFLEETARKGLMVILASSDPRNRTVAPFGGLTPTYSPDPLAVGIPTKTDPIMIDVSMSVTSNALVARSNRNNEKLPHQWLLDKEGNPTDDPKTFFENPPSTILPLGGIDSGYKGFGLGLMVEALTSGLAGQGRAENPTRWGCNVFLQVIDPQRFMGKNAFIDEVEFLKKLNLESKPIDTKNPVRMPGQRGLEKKREQLENGVKLLEETENGLRALSERMRVKIS